MPCKVSSAGWPEFAETDAVSADNHCQVPGACPGRLDGSLLPAPGHAACQRQGAFLQVRMSQAALSPRSILAFMSDQNYAGSYSAGHIQVMQRNDRQHCVNHWKIAGWYVEP